MGTVLSKQRGAIMGLAACVVVLFHLKLHTPFELYNYLISRNGNIAVDIFQFLSGFGLAFALQKNSDYYRFMKRRMERILPPYYIALILLLALYLIQGIFPIRWFFENFIPLHAWLSGHGRLWYVSGVIVYYALTPLFYFMILKARYPRTMLVFLLLCVGLFIPAFSGFAELDIALMRFSPLVLGIGMGIFQKMHTKPSDRFLDFLVVAISFAVGIFIVNHRGEAIDLLLEVITPAQAGRLCKSIIAPLVVVGLAYMLEGFERTPLRFLNAAFRQAGRYSLEIYLSHSVIMDALGVLSIEGWLEASITLLLSHPLAVVLSRVGKRCLPPVMRFLFKANSGVCDC